MSIINKLIDRITMKKYRLELKIDTGRIIIKAYKDNMPYSVLGVFNAGLSMIRSFCIMLENGDAQVKTEDFEKVKYLFLTSKPGNCELAVSPEIAALSVNRSGHVVIDYFYNNEKNIIERILTEDTVVWNNDYVLKGNMLYFLNNKYNFDLTREIYSGEEIITFLARIRNFKP